MQTAPSTPHAEPPSAVPPSATNDDAEAGQPTALTTTVAAEPRAMAVSMASELAGLVSALEARAHHLIEAAPTRTSLPQAAEALLNSIERMHLLHKKLTAFGAGHVAEPGTTEVTELIAGLSDELAHMQLGLELRWEPPSALPPLAIQPSIGRDVMLFLFAALLRAERDATRLTFTVERSFTRARPTLRIELNLERITVAEDPRDAAFHDQAFALDLEAARQLIVSHNGELSLAHLPGKSVRAVVRLPVAIAEAEAQDAEDATATNDTRTPSDSPSAPDGAHRYGGALVLEADPALRSVLARELKASGRAVFACADGSSAHTFLEATPDRFELLIVDDAHQLASHTPLARTIRARAPDLKICLLTSHAALPPDDWPHAECLRKPFGVHELRRKLAALLQAS